MGDANVSSFIEAQRRLLELELRAEEDAADAASKSKDNDDTGGCFFLRNVDIVDTSVGLYGRTVVSFAAVDGSSTWEQSEVGGCASKRGSTQNLLPAHRLTVGDVVDVLPNNGKTKSIKRSSGVICGVTDCSISVALGADSKSQRKQTANSERNNAKRKGRGSAGDDELDDHEMALGGDGPYCLVPASNVEVHRKMVSALVQLEKNASDDRSPAIDIIRAAFQPNDPKFRTDLSRLDIEKFERVCGLSETRLDHSQREAVITALYSNNPINLILGPPGRCGCGLRTSKQFTNLRVSKPATSTGTGKTTTVAHLIQAAVHKKGWKVLVTAPSNVAVDNVLERLMGLEGCLETDHGKRKGKKKGNNRKIKAVRLGHPARIQQGIQGYSLESRVQSAEGTEIVKDCRCELKQYIKTLSDTKSRPGEKRTAYREMNTLRREIRQREETIVSQILRESNVVFATNVGAASSLFKRMVGSNGEPIAFDLVVIDEAGQALEASCWISLLKGNRAVLAGDHKQLPPTVKSSMPEVQRGLSKTLFERLMTAYESNDSRAPGYSMLKVQYRMHRDISDWASKAMYNGQLVSHESVRDRKLSDLPQIVNDKDHDADKTDTALNSTTLLLVDTTGCDLYETENSAGSRSNEGEAAMVVSHVNMLLALGLRAEDIAIITPYNGQVELLRNLLLPQVPNLEIRSVDGFQGGEREAVVLSLVRSSDRGRDGIGFLSDARRLNVAVTRARRHCAVICDVETVSTNQFIKGLTDWMEEKGEYRSAAEYGCDDIITGDSSSLPMARLQHAANNSEGDLQRPLEKNARLDDRNKSHVIKPNHQETLMTKIPGVGSQDGEGCENATGENTALLDRVKGFADGEKNELTLSPRSGYERILVQELAKAEGLTFSEIDERSVVLGRARPSSMKVVAVDDSEPVASTFGQLTIDDNSSSESEDEQETSNSVLKQLAKEREERRQQREQQQQQREQPQQPVASNSKKKKKQKKKKSSGGQKKNLNRQKLDEGENLDDLDDMAFLDAQIDKQQNSHGRKIEAKGNGYRSIINGVLLSTPQSRSEETKAVRKNPAATSSLRAKIKSSTDSRKVKSKKKK